MTHDYVRNGTTSLFAAYLVLDTYATARSAGAQRRRWPL
jgi:hypothetical protein